MHLVKIGGYSLETKGVGDGIIQTLNVNSYQKRSRGAKRPSMNCKKLIVSLTQEKRYASQDTLFMNLGKTIKSWDPGMGIAYILPQGLGDRTIVESFIHQTIEFHHKVVYPIKCDCLVPCFVTQYIKTHISLMIVVQDYNTPSLVRLLYGQVSIRLQIKQSLDMNLREIVILCLIGRKSLNLRAHHFLGTFINGTGRKCFRLGFEVL